MNEFEKNYWWHQGKKFLVNELVKKYGSNIKNEDGLRILEIGCGTGEITESLQKYGNVTGIDMSNEAADFCRERGLENIIVADINTINIDSLEKYDLVLALDVLEHIQDDIEAIKRVGKLLSQDGYFIINVPAYKFLWSEHDEALQHKRRYSTYEIKRKLEDNGFEIVKMSYFVFAAFPFIAMFKFLKSVFGRSAYPKTSYIQIPNFVNKIMTKVLETEAHLLNYTYLPFGTTITLVAKKADVD